MKKYLSFAVTAMAILGLGSLTSCHDEDFDVSTTVLQERAFEQGFIKEFGKPDANQSWDFYAQKMESLRQQGAATRATMATEVSIKDTIQPTDKEYFQNVVSDMIYVLEDEIDNSNVGQNHYSLASTGTFNIYAIEYCGDYQKKSQYQFSFGLAYLDDNGTEHRQQLFSYYTTNSSTPVNPGYAKKVTITKGASFYFYMSLVVNNYTYIYRSNSSTYTRTRNNNTTTLSYEDGKYDGPSTLVYSMEVNDEAEGDKQIMILGFEDGWSGTADHDFNDVVLIIEGDLPVPTAKRFYAEDKESFDWDYNDVVFDVMNTGIVLRAVGGTLPVFLRVTDRRGPSSKHIVQIDGVGELHELMGSIQPQTIHQNEILTYKRNVRNEETGQLEEKTFYKPIDVGANPGVWLDAVRIEQWQWSSNANQNKRLEDGEVELFANPLVDNPVGDVELIVLPEYQTSYNLDAIAQLDALDPLGSDEGDAKRPKIVRMGTPGDIPAIWSAPVSVMWMKELQKITLGYPGFYGGGNTQEVTNLPMWWEVGPLDRSYMYDFTGDYDPDDPE